MGPILHIIVVGFHHAHGPIVEYAFPPFPGQKIRTALQRLEVPEEWSLLPFLALPDGSHQSDEDFTYFHLPPAKGRKDAGSKSTLFGISCNRQILTKDLLVKTEDVTRSSVQKAVVVLATQPIFGVLRQRLAVVTAAWFGQKDFTQTDILPQFYESLSATVSDSIPDSAFMMGTSLGELVKKFKYKVLVLLKLLLLEKRVIFFGYPVETLCTYQYSMISLIPGLLKSLQDTGSPLLDSQELYMQSMSKTPAQSTDKQALFKYLGLPLHIFGEGSFFQPYMPLQQIDILQDPITRSYIIGTTNAIFLHNRDCSADVIVNTEPGTIDFLQDSLTNVLSLTSADRRWMDEVIEAVNSGNTQTEYNGSDDYLRAKFEEYILTLLSTVKHSQFTQADDSIESIDKNLISDYGVYFVKAWQQTPNYQLWNDFVDWELLNEIVAPGHPCQGNFSLVHVQRRLANQFKDMRIDKNLEPWKQSISKAMSTSRVRLSNVFDSVWQEFEKLQPEDGSTMTYEPAIYTPRTREGSMDHGKGLVHETSTNPIQRTAARSVPDPDVTPEDDLHDAIVPPPTHRASPRPISAQPQPFQQPSLSSSPRSTTSIGSPVSGAFNTLGPATAATAVLGQKAAGMFTNVSSFFQAKKKEFMDAQLEAEEEYQQRIHQHERKKRVMQERARATASTFAISPKLPPRPSSTISSVSSPTTTAGIPDDIATSSASGGTIGRSGSLSRETVNSLSPETITAQTPISLPSNLRSDTLSSYKKSGPASEAVQLEAEPPVESKPEHQTITPKPSSSTVTSPTLTRGRASIEQIHLSLQDKSPDEVQDLDEESLQELEKELQEALLETRLPVPDPEQSDVQKVVEPEERTSSQVSSQIREVIPANESSSSSIVSGSSKPLS